MWWCAIYHTHIPQKIMPVLAVLSMSMLLVVLLKFTFKSSPLDHIQKWPKEKHSIKLKSLQITTNLWLYTENHTELNLSKTVIWNGVVNTCMLFEVYGSVKVCGKKDLLQRVCVISVLLMINKKKLKFSCLKLGTLLVPQWFPHNSGI